MVTIQIDADRSETLGGGHDWSPELHLRLADGVATLTARSRHSGENGIPVDVFHGLAREWRQLLPSGTAVAPNPDAIVELAERLRPVLSRVADGQSVEWDGSNYVGRLTDDAQEACLEVDGILEAAQWVDEDIAVWHAGDWLSHCALSDIGLSPDSNEEAIAAAAAIVERDAADDNTRIIEGRDAIVEEIRRKVAEANEDYPHQPLPAALRCGGVMMERPMAEETFQARGDDEAARRVRMSTHHSRAGPAALIAIDDDAGLYVVREIDQASLEPEWSAKPDPDDNGAAVMAKAEAVAAAGLGSGERLVTLI